MMCVVRGGVVVAMVATMAMCGGSAAAQPQTRQSWDSLSPEQRSQVRERYQQFRKLPEPDRHQVEQQYRRWQNLPPNQRQQLRQNYDSYRGLDSSKRRQFEENYRNWKATQGAPNEAEH